MNESSNQGESAEAERVAELRDRIETLSRLGDEELGSFTPLDWLLCVLVGAVIPLLLLYWGAP